MEQEGRFESGTYYSFDLPVETNCVSLLPNSKWTRGKFAGGTCVRYEKKVQGYMFRGVPLGQSPELVEEGGRLVYKKPQEFYFVVALGKGSIAEENLPDDYSPEF